MENSTKTMVGLVTVSLATLGFLTVVPTASAHCLVSVGLSSCYGDCAVNAALSYCGTGATCDVNVVGDCYSGGTCDVNVLSTCAGACWLNVGAYCSSTGYCPVNVVASCYSAPDPLP